jgi:hypothetical protein
MEQFKICSHLKFYLEFPISDNQWSSGYMPTMDKTVEIETDITIMVSFGEQLL